MIHVHHLNCLELIAPGNVRGVGHCLLIETDRRLLLIDVGIGLIDTADPDRRLGQPLIDAAGFRFHPEWTAAHQIRQLGLNPGKVTDCVVSHLDPDHIGGLADFPDAVVHVSQEEYEAFRQGDPRYLPHQLDHQPPVHTYPANGSTWFGWEARRLPFPEVDIYLIPLFGHTAGHCGIALYTGTDWLFYTADAYYLRAELTVEQHPVDAFAASRAVDNDQRVATLEKLRRFVAKYPEIRLFGYHDPEEITMFMPNTETLD